MNVYGGMRYPEGEKHMIEWLAKNGVMVNGRAIYQWKKQQATFAACKSFRTAVDIGAHIGHWSLGMLDRFATVHAFEPVREHRECFAANVPADPTLTMHPFALGSHVGQVRIARAAGNSGASHIGEHGDLVEMVTLDSFNLDDVDLIKMDVEGYEAEVIAGARETLLRCKPIVCCEQKRDFACKYGLKADAATSALKALGMRQIQEIGGDFIMGWPA
jgi:FkbM family methyltransferase